MTNVSDTSSGANSPPLVDLADPVVRARWLAAARSQAEDLISAGSDATAPPDARDLGRRAARRIIGDAGGALRQLLDAAGAPPVAEADRTKADAPRAT